MTTPADDRAAEEAFEACLAGRTVPEGAQGLVAFTDALRAGATVPGRPNAALAELLATGLLPDASTRTAGPARSSRKRPRMILSTLVTKFVAAGAVAKAATAGGAAALVLTGAATAQVLPGQDVAPAAVESSDTTGTGTEPVDAPTEVPDGENTDVPDGEDTGVVTAPEDDVEDGGDAPAAPVEDGTGEDAGEIPALEEQVSYDIWVEGPAEGQTFSQWVRSGARAGVSDGATVSCFAQVRNGRRDASECRPPVPAPVEEAPVPGGDEPAGTAPEAPVADEETAPAPVPAQTRPAPVPAQTAPGAGNGSGDGGGNGANGNAGNGNGNGGAGGGNGNGNRGR